MSDVQSSQQNKKHNALIWITLAVLVFLWGAQRFFQQEKNAAVSNLQQKALTDFENKILQKWKKTYTELPTNNLIVVTPHNDEIRSRFENAFVQYYALEKGRRVLIWWHNIGGSNAILDYLVGDWQKNKHNKFDVVFGGGEYLFQRLAEADLLARQDMTGVASAIPASLNNVALYDPQNKWCGNALSGFGFLYNKEILKAAGVDELKTWQDLGQNKMTGHLVFADPIASGSTVTLFEMIIQSEKDWPSGWSRLISILSNAKTVANGSDDAANAPAFDQAGCALCIDFYGFNRVEWSPEKLVYVSPAGQTAFLPDPIAILKDSTNFETAKAFVDFVLSPEGQKVWGLEEKAGIEAKTGIVYRQPIRRDFYELNAGSLPKWSVNPYKSETGMKLDNTLRFMRYNILIQLVHAAVIENMDLLKQARPKMTDAGTGFKAPLPPDVDSLEKIQSLSTEMQNPESSRLKLKEWSDFYKTYYSSLIQ